MALLRTLLGLSLAAVLLASCKDVALGDPAPRSIAPALGPNDAPVTVTIEGDNLLPRVITDFQHHGQDAVDATYQARLGTTELTAVTLTAAGVLTAVVPAGLTPGTYDLVVTDPRGRSGTLAQAFRVFDPSVVDTFSFAAIATQEKGTPFTITLTAVNAQGQTITSFAGPVSLSDRTGTLTPTTSGAFTAGVWSGSATVAAASSADAITATDGTRSGVSNDFVVTERAPAGIVFTSAPVVARAGDCSAVMLGLVDDQGGATVAGGALAVTLAATPPTGFGFFSDAGCTAAAGSVTFASGAATATLYVRGTAVQAVTLDATTAGLTGASQLATITAGAPAAISFLTAAQTLAIDTCSADVTFEIRDAFGNPIDEAADVTVSLGAGSGLELFAAGGCTTVVSTRVIAAGQAQGAFRFRGSVVGTFPLTVGAGGGVTGTQDAVIVPGAATAIVFITAPQTVSAGACSSALTFELQDARGNPTSAGTPLSFPLASTPTGLTFSSSPGCATATAQATVAAGQTGGSIYFSGTVAQGYTLTVGSGALSASQPETIVGGAPSSVVLTGAPQAAAPATCALAAETAVLHDASGNLATVSSPVSVALSSTPAGLSFFSDAGCTTPITSLTFGPGVTTQSFYWSGTVPGPYTITASGAGLLSGTKSATIAGATARGPTMIAAVPISTTLLRVYFSSDLRQDSTTAPQSITNVANWCIEVNDGDGTACTQTAAFSIVAVTAVDSKTFDVTTSGSFGGTRMLVRAQDATDVGGKVLESPQHAKFFWAPTTQPVFQVEFARSLGSTSLEVVFTRALTAGSPETPGSAGCGAGCGVRYRLVGPNDLGTITSGVLSSADDHRVILTHTNPQVAAEYEVVVANNLNGDGFDEAKAIQAADGTGIGARPADRAPFHGTGVVVEHFADGPAFSNPFGDDPAAVPIPPSAILHRGRVYLGPDKDGMMLVRTEPDGSRAEKLTFRVFRDYLNANDGPSLSANAYGGIGAGHPSVGAKGCTQNTDSAYCGPDDENAPALMGSLTDGTNHSLLFGPGITADHSLRYAYFTSQDDRLLETMYVDLTKVLGAVTVGMCAAAVSSGRAYLAFSDSGGNKPMLVTAKGSLFNRPNGLDPVVNGGPTNNSNASCTSSDSVCYLSATTMPKVGGVTSIDTLFDHGGRLYVANSGGLVRSMVATPDNYAATSADWVDITPNPISGTGSGSAATSGITPGSRAWPQFALYKNKVYAIRNTTLPGPQLYKCSPAASGDPSYCDATDWTLIATDSAAPSLSKFNNSFTNVGKVSLLVANGPYLYVGYDGNNGIMLFRTSVDDPAAITDFEGAAPCPATTACTPFAGAGLGLASNGKVLAAFSAPGVGGSYLYVLTGNGIDPPKLYRQKD